MLTTVADVWTCLGSFAAGLGIATVVTIRRSRSDVASRSVISPAEFAEASRLIEQIRNELIILGGGTLTSADVRSGQ